MRLARPFAWLVVGYPAIGWSVDAFPELTDVARVGETVVVSDSYEVTSVLAGYRFDSKDFATGRSRKVSRKISVLSDSAISVAYAEFKFAAAAGVLGIPMLSSDPRYEGQTFTISLIGATLLVSGASAADHNTQESILGDLRGSLGWIKATTLLRSQPSRTFANGAGVGSPTPDLLVGPAIAVRSISLTRTSDDPATGSITYSTTLLVAADCGGKPLVMSGTLVLIPGTRFELTATGAGVAIPTENCAVSPELLGCTQSPLPVDDCRFALPGVTSSIKVVRSISKAP